MTADDLAALRRVVSVKPLEWVARDDIVDLYNAQSPTGWWYNIRKLQDGRFKYSGDPAASPVPTAQTFQCLDFAKAAAQDDYERRILSALTLASRAIPAAPDVGEEKRVKVPGGQTPLDDNLSHRYLAVLDEGSKARDSGEGSPYHGHSLEHCLHATGWVSRDLRLALNKAREECKTACDQARRQAYAECIAALKKEREAFLSEEYAYPQPIGSLSERFACDECIKAIEALAEANS